MALAPELISVKVQIRRTTEKAMLVEYEDETLWLPLSQIENWEDTPDGFTRVTMSAWIAKEKGII